MSRSLKPIILVLLLVALSAIVYTRGFGWRLGTVPGTIEGEFTGEEAWVVTEVVRDITEMSAYAGGRRAAADEIHPVRVGDGQYRVAATELRGGPVSLNVQQDLWAPDAFAGIARAALPDGPAQPPATAADVDSVLEVRSALLEVTPATLIESSQSVSRRLAANMRDPEAHEAAALTVGAFALREAARDFSDVRWALNRITAHLAIADVLRQGTAPPVGRRIAGAILLALANHQVRALQAIDDLQRTDDDAAQRWARALRLRVTQDWRALDNPRAASRVERQEYFRARRATVPRRRADSDLQTLRLTDGTDALRIMQSYSRGVADGAHVIENALASEWQEAVEVFTSTAGHAPSADLAGDLNARATRCMNEGRPNILPWGAWAEFLQRHLAVHIALQGRFYRDKLARPDDADRVQGSAHAAFKGLTLFPLASIFWTKDVRGKEADLTYIREAIAAASASPERVTSRLWYFLERSAKYEPVARGMSPGAQWFIPLSSRALYDAGWRVEYLPVPPNPQETAALIADAPYDFALAAYYVKTRYGVKAPAEELRRLLGPRLEYDLRAIGFVAERTNIDAERLPLAASACRISDVECSGFAAELARAGREDEAAKMYERAFADQDIDDVRLSNWSGWLVSYYYRHRQLDRAIELAEKSSATGSQQGLLTAAYLYERLGRAREAETLYRQVASRYDDNSQLIGFYYRAVKTRKQTEYQDSLKGALATAFPEGLMPVTAAVDQHPAHGMVIVKDNDFVRKAGLQAGDIVIGLERFRVDNMAQYRAVNAIFETDRMQLTVWRGKTFDVTLDAPGRLMGIEFRTYPVEGWSEK